MNSIRRFALFTFIFCMGCLLSLNCFATIPIASLAPMLQKVLPAE